MNRLNIITFNGRMTNDATLTRFFRQLPFETHYCKPREFLSSRTSSRADVYLLDAMETSMVDQQLLDQCLSCPSASLRLALIRMPAIPSGARLLARFDDFILWPCGETEFLARLSCHSSPAQQSRLGGWERDLVKRFTALNLIGESRVFVETLALIDKLADSHAPLLLQGETGTGKENAARSIHYLSARRDRAFVPINCGAIPDELFESELFGHEKGAFTDAKQSQAGLVEVADGGTLFLDEVDSLSLKAQAALLRFLQNKEYRPIGARQVRRAQVRILAATNADLKARTESKAFREDLFYRLYVLAVRMPPLRERVEDIPLLVDRLLEKFAQEYSCEPKQCSRRSLQFLMSRPWEGNVRELENFLLREFLLSDGPIIHIGSAIATDDDRDDAPAVPGQFQQEKAEAIAAFEEGYLKRVLALSDGNISAAARLAGKERRALGKLIKKYKIDKQRPQVQPHPG